VCEEGFFVIVLALKTTFYLVVLLCTILLLMGEFYVDNKYPFKEERKFRIKAMCIFVFSSMWWKMVQAMELDNGVRLQEVLNFPS
jgi:hypothetical protein